MEGEHQEGGPHGNRVRGMILFLYPEHMTPVARRQFLRLAEAFDAEDLLPSPPMPDDEPPAQQGA